MEDQLRKSQAEMSQMEGTMRRASESAAESKKKLLQAEVKIRQLTGATVKDLPATPDKVFRAIQKAKNTNE